MNNISNGATALPLINTIIFSGDSEAVAQFVGEALLFSDFDYQSITITNRAQSEDFYVRIVIDTSLVDTVVKQGLICSLQHISTSPLNTQAG